MTSDKREVAYQGVLLRNCGASQNAQDIDLLERTLRFKLPLDYRRFLIEANGGAPDNYSYIAIPGQQVVLFGDFLGVSTIRSLDLSFWHRELDDRIAETQLVIAFDPGGNIFLYDFDDEYLGIYYWDKASVFSSTDEDTNLYFVAETFTEFLSRMRPSQEEAEADLQKFTIPERILAERDGNEPDRPPSPEDDLKGLLEQESSFEKRLILVGQHFINKLDFESPLDTAIAGFSLSLPLSAWDRKRHDKLIESRVEKANTDPVLLDVIQNDPKTLQLFLLLFGYVMGQYHADKLSDRQYVYSQDTIVSAMRTVIPKLSQ